VGTVLTTAKNHGYYHVQLADSRKRWAQGVLQTVGRRWSQRWRWTAQPGEVLHGEGRNHAVNRRSVQTTARQERPRRRFGTV